MTPGASQRFTRAPCASRVGKFIRSLLKYPCTPRESALGPMARRERRAYPLARPPACSRYSPPPPRWSVRREQRRQMPQSALGSPTHQQPLFPSATSARRVASLLALGGVARLAEIAGDIGTALAPWPVLKSTATRHTPVLQQSPKGTSQPTCTSSRRLGNLRGSTCCYRNPSLPGKDRNQADR